MRSGVYDFHKSTFQHTQRMACQGYSVWSIYSLLVNWAVVSVLGVFYFTTAHQLLIVNMKYNKSQPLNILCH